MKTNRKHFEIFKKECYKWIEYFGLKNWDIDYRHKAQEGNRADISFNQWGRVATIGLASDWKHSIINDKNIKKCAFHEVCELLLAKLNNFGTNKALHCPDDVEEEIHIVIRILENTVFEKK